MLLLWMFLLEGAMYAASSGRWIAALIGLGTIGFTGISYAIDWRHKIS